jgi:putative transposase
VKRILKEHGYDPMPKRGDGSWDEFLKRHAASLWQCDFLGKRVVTLCGGIRTAYVLVFIHLKTRQVIVSPSTLNPDDEWVCAQTERFVHLARGRGLPVEYLQHDSDTKFRGSFPATLESLGVRGSGTRSGRRT